MEMQFLDNIPIWAFYVGFSALLYGAHEAGRARYNKDVAEYDTTQNPFVQNTVFALITFLLGFTFSMASSQYEQRRATTIEHAVAISTAYAETDFLEDSVAEKSRQLYHSYTQEIVDLERKVVQSGAMLWEAEQFLSDLWDISVEFTKANPGPVSIRYSNSLVSVTDLHKERADRALWLTVPDFLILQLFLLTAFAMYSIGRHGVLKQSARRVAIPVVYAVVFALIIDLNRPFGGLFGVNQQPVLEVITSIEKDLVVEQ